MVGVHKVWYGLVRVSKAWQGLVSIAQLEIILGVGGHQFERPLQASSKIDYYCLLMKNNPSPIESNWLVPDNGEVGRTHECHQHHHNHPHHHPHHNP